jgi:hypothetical protein
MAHNDQDNAKALRQIAKALIHVAANLETQPSRIDMRPSYYSDLYFARRELGKIVAQYGEGQPK